MDLPSEPTAIRVTPTTFPFNFVVSSIVFLSYPLQSYAVCIGVSFGLHDEHL